jgi:hypothetical protein
MAFSLPISARQGCHHGHMSGRLGNWRTQLDQLASARHDERGTTVSIYERRLGAPASSTRAAKGRAR